MTEEILLDTALSLLEEEGAAAAYLYLKKQVLAQCPMTSQVYNFLYCLGAVCGHTEEALGWLQQAIVEKGFWYRPEVFEDDDLASLQNNPRFQACKKLSETRYFSAISSARTVCTWQTATSPRLALTLHGNQQNLSHSKAAWKSLEQLGWQTEQVQSQTLDSYELYRWEDDGDGGFQLCGILDQLPAWKTSKKRMLCGFSSGCGAILDALSIKNILCDEIILMAPWIPSLQKCPTELVRGIKSSGARLSIFCGQNDKDCLPMAQLLEQQALTAKIPVRFFPLPGLGHRFPENWENLLQSLTFLK